MLNFLVKRIVLAIAVAITVSIITFGLVRLSGDPAVAMAGEGASTADVESVRKLYGFDRPIVVQYLSWAGRALEGDFGHSPFLNADVSGVVAERLPPTLMLGGAAITLAILLAVPLGVLAAVFRNTLIDRVVLVIAVTGQAVPTFWFSLILIVWLGIKLRILPISGSTTWLHFVMPAMALGLYVLPAILRLTRAGMIDALSADYIRTAKAKGLRPGRIIFKHALRNAIVPVVALSAVQFGFMLGGSVVVETIFAINGMGLLAWESIRRSDFPTMQAIVLVLSGIYIALSLLGDALNALLDPRLREK
jgi:peptide/nickel transport system permease protein